MKISQKVVLMKNIGCFSGKEVVPFINDRSRLSVLAKERTKKLYSDLKETRDLERQLTRRDTYCQLCSPSSQLVQFSLEHHENQFDIQHFRGVLQKCHPQKTLDSIHERLLLNANDDSKKEQLKKSIQILKKRKGSLYQRASEQTPAHSPS